MFTTESKLYLGIAAAALVSGAVYFVASGDRMGGVLFGALLVAAAFVGVLVVGRPVGVPGAAGAVVEPASLPRRHAEAMHSSAWPLVAGIGTIVALAGLAVDVPTIVLGAIVAVVALGGWFVEIWRDHLAQAKPGALFAHQRVVLPGGTPVLGVVAIGVLAISLSRILLAVSKEAATVIALVVSAAILTAAFLVSARRRLSAGALTGMVSITALAIVVGGVVATGAGERDIPAHPLNLADLVAQGIQYDKTELTFEGEGAQEIHLVNRDVDTPHNVAVYASDDAAEQLYFGDAIYGLGRREYVLDLEPGEYFFRCEFHPTQMTGSIAVAEPAHHGEGGEDHGDEGDHGGEAGSTAGSGH